MKKFIIFTLLSISVFTVNSCNDDNNPREIIIPNVGNVAYRGYNLPLHYAQIEDLKRYENGISYIVELSTNPINPNGRSLGAYMYFEIFVANGNSLSGDYVKNDSDLSVRKLNFLEFHVDPIIEDDRVIASSFSAPNSFFPSGFIRLRNHEANLLVADCSATDLEGVTLNANFEGVFTFIRRFDKAIGKSPSNPQLRKKVEEAQAAKGVVRKPRSDR